MEVDEAALECGQPVVNDHLHPVAEVPEAKPVGGEMCTSFNERERAQWLLRYVNGPAMKSSRNYYRDVI